MSCRIPLTNQKPALSPTQYRRPLDVQVTTADINITLGQKQKGRSIQTQAIQIKNRWARAGRLWWSSSRRRCRSKTHQETRSPWPCCCRCTWTGHTCRCGPCFAVRGRNKIKQREFVVHFKLHLNKLFHGGGNRCQRYVDHFVKRSLIDWSLFQHFNKKNRVGTIQRLNEINRVKFDNLWKKTHKKQEANAWTERDSEYVKSHEDDIQLYFNSANTLPSN